MLNKICPRCQGVMSYDKKLCDRCTEIVGSHRAIRDKVYQEHRVDKEFQSIYKSARWKRVRSLALARANGLCEVCMQQGKVSFVDDVHHKVPIKVNKSKAFDITNLICLCRACHIQAHKDLERGRG